MRSTFLQLAGVFLRRLWVPVAVFAGFNLLCVLVYHRLEGLRWLDAFFWITHPHSMDYTRVHMRPNFLPSSFTSPCLRFKFGSPSGYSSPFSAVRAGRPGNP